MNENIIALIVTYNRINFLKKSLEIYKNMRIKPKKILIVDNFSSDGTKEFLEKWMNEKEKVEKEVVFLKENIGGSGGFYTGLKLILDKYSKDYEWVYISDDDAFPKLDLFEKFSLIKKEDNVGAICAKIINNGNVDVGHRRKIDKNFEERPIDEIEYKKESFLVNLFSYVGTFISIKCLKKVGLPEKEYFIWYDDTEHSYRVNKEYRILCYPILEVEHNTGKENLGFSWKTYYGIRNKTHMLKKHMTKWKFLFYCLKMKFKIKSKFLRKKISKKEYECFKEAFSDALNDKLGKRG